MDIDFGELEIYFDYDVIEEIRSMTEEDIATAYEAVEDAVYEEWARVKAEIIEGKYGDDIFLEAKSWARSLYFEDHPDEKDGETNDGEIDDDEFELFLQNHDEEYRNVLERIAKDSIINGGIFDRIVRDGIEKASQDLGLSDSILAYLYHNDGQLPLKK
jgi:hypothetical protein